MKNVLDFLTKLSANNNREWFADNKKEFETAKQEFEHLVGEVIAAVGQWDADVRALAPKDCVYRIYRDVRFSKDKIPYKTSMGALIGKGGRKAVGTINYLHVEPSKSFAAGGFYMPDSPSLKAIRQEIDYNLAEFEGILNNKAFKDAFGSIDSEMKLKTLPKGYAADNPAIEYLKLKSFTVSRYFTDKEVLGKNFVGEVEKSFGLIKPLNTFLGRAKGADAK